MRHKKRKSKVCKTPSMKAGSLPKGTIRKGGYGGSYKVSGGRKKRWVKVKRRKR